MSTIRTPRPSSGPSSGVQPAAGPLPADPTNLAIFGATGDLANRKLLPALYNLAHDGALPERFNLVGVSRSEMSDEEFRELAVYGQDAAPIFAPLSPREVEILDNIAQGMTNKQVAYALSISEQTVKNHMSSILRKLSVNDRTQAVVYAMRQGWIRMPED